MDAIEFIKEQQRLCQTYTRCSECPVGNDNDGCKFNTVSGYKAAEQIRLLEEWSAAHLCKTRQDVFLEQYPQAEIDTLGCLILCPKRISVDCRIRYGNCTNRICSDCRKEFWSQEVE